MPAPTLLHKHISTHYLHASGIRLLKQLISIPSISREEDKSATAIAMFLATHGIPVQRRCNNVWAMNKHYDPALPTVLLNSHHDTVKPNAGYTLNPFEAIEREGKLFGLGSNDAGGALVGLIMAFIYFYNKRPLKYNLVLAATAEEEISGKNGIELVFDELGPVAAAVVGEPTGMNLAVTEKGLLVIDCVAHGTAGHAAHPNVNNAIYNAMDAVEWFKTFRFPKKSDTLGEVSMAVTIIKAGNQHNLVPDRCEFTVDIRSNDAYTHEEILALIRQHINCEVTPRSLRLRASAIDISHPLVQAANRPGKIIYGSPTISDRALIKCPSLKIGPGDSKRSHSSDEFIFIHEIKEGIDGYIQLLSNLLQHD